MLKASLLCLMGLSVAHPSYALPSETIVFPGDASKAEKAQFCVTISTAMNYALSYGAYVNHSNSSGGNAVSWVGTTATPSNELVELIGGVLAYDKAVSQAGELEQYWKDYGENYFANVVAEGTTPFVSETGGKLASAFMDCLNWQQTIKLIWKHPTGQVKFAFPGAPDIFTPKATTENSGN